MKFRSTSTILAAVVLAGCPGKEEPKATTAQPPRVRAAPPKPKPKPTPKPSQIRYAGRTYAPKHSVVVFDAEKHELRVALLAFEPSPAELVRIRRDETFFVLSGKPSPDPRQWPGHMPYASVKLDWRWKKDKLGDAKAAMASLHVHGVDKKGGNASISFTAPDGKELRLSGELAEGAEVELELEGERELGGQSLTWKLKVKGTVLLPPPTPKPPQVKPEQTGPLGYVTQGDRVVKVEAACAVWRAKDRQLDVLLLPVTPDEELVAAHRLGKGLPRSWRRRTPQLWSGRLKLSWDKAEEVGQLEKSSGTFVVSGVTKTSVHVFLNRKKHPYTLEGSPQVGEAVSLEARGVHVHFGEAIAWGLKLEDLTILSELHPQARGK